ncbi:TPA: aquaporin, partial [Salmonella enterica subsp. enterica serovar Typhi]|nr:aquaporin [Salmonella enterica]HAF3004960.1 aquaporin [Salmonella enterica subsp. enterica serovar Typhi]HAF3866086.1 aquaporin [Salmonella enterica subsp. enterica serovar Paratyphi A]EJM9247567.1 aquaporin [Salmonella enterica]HAF3009270.1 aquaporin [Salmonella enterica subsp. enterica serovar Typhi]
NMAMSGGREISYFIVPIVAPVIGACAGAAIYRYFIGKNLPCNRCKL